MADISKIKVSNNTTYDIKDAVARSTKIDTSTRGAANGVATLDASGRVPLSQINYLGIYIDEDGDLCQED